MVRSPKFLVLSLAVLALGVSLNLSRRGGPLSKVKSVDEYWADTGLRPSAIEDLIDDESCKSSLRYFMSCANALVGVAGHYDLQITTDGSFKNDSHSSEILSERQQLEPWKQFFLNSEEKAKKISFLTLWKSLRKNVIKKNQTAYATSMAVNSFLSVFRDPHTYLIPVQMYNEVVAKADNKSSALGIVIAKSTDGYFLRKVMDGSASALAGLKRGDLLLEINDTRVIDLSPSKVGDLLRADVNGVTQVGILREGKKIKIKVDRSHGQLLTVSHRVIDGLRPVGLITINKFAKSTCEKTKEALLDLKKQNVRGLMMDLRDNPGGQIEEAACVASLFLGPDKKVFELRYLDPAKESEVYTGDQQQNYKDNLAIMINGGSASASEIVAGALRDYGRATLVGEKSFGKGSVQEGEIWDKNPKIALFATKGFYYLPSGVSPQMHGLEPDVKVAFSSKLIQMREFDQYVHPLMPQQKGNVQSLNGRRVSLDECLDAEEDLHEDPQLQKARLALLCKTAVVLSGGKVNDSH